jgi:hypothetical protein
MGSSSGSVSKARVVVGVVLALVMFAMSVAGFLLPVHADVGQPPPAGTDWVGIAPTVTVDCGRFWDPQPPTWPSGVEDVTIGDQRNAVEACASAYSNTRLMSVVSGGMGVLIVALILRLVLRSRARA